MLYLDPLAFALSLLLACAIVWGYRQKKSYLTPHYKFSFLQGWKKTSLEWRARLASWPEKLLFTSLACLLAAFADPHFRKEINPENVQSYSSPTEGIAIYFILDQSGSMAEEVQNGRQRIKKMDLLKQVTREFIIGDAETGLKGRKNDLLGLVSFARGAHVLSPLTLNHASILKQLNELDVIHDRSQDGTSIGYAIYKTANLIAATRHYAQELESKGKPAYAIKSNVMILVTDGLQDPNPLDKGKRLRNIDLQEAAQFAKEQGIRLYAILIEPKLATEEYAPYRHLMQRITEMTGGKFFMISNTNNLPQIYKDIDTLEKSALPEQNKKALYRRFSMAPYLIAFALLCLFMAVFLKSAVLRISP